MPQHQVKSTDQILLAAEQVWNLVRDFCGTWHPAIESMKPEYDDAGRLIRVFTVKGDNTIYRERLTWFSDSDMSLAYTHVAGIAGIKRYNATLSVTPTTETSCTVTLTAELTADEPRATEIATGTQAIFNDAVTVINKLSTSTKAADAPALVDNGNTGPKLQQQKIPGTPELAISLSHKTDSINDIWCLFLHGIGGNRQNWLNQIAAVSPYCAVAALDLRGYGESDLGDQQSTIENYCDDILRVAKSLHAKRLVLCGLSYGAWIATSFAMRHPERLAAVVLSGGCTGMSEASVEEREAFRQSREVPLNEGKTPADFAPAVVDVLAGPTITASVKSQLLESMQAIPPATYADALRCFTTPTEQFDFSRLSMPTLLMTGDSDKLAPPDEIRRVAQRIRQSSPKADVRFECLPCSGHVCNLENPQAYNAPLIELIERVVR